MRNPATIYRTIQAKLRWLMPGMGVKRWLLVLLAGATLLGLGFGYVLLDLYRTVPVPDAVGALTLQFLPRLVRAVLFGGLGVGLMAWSLNRIQQTLLAPFLRPGQDLASTLNDHRRRGRGPRIVAIGGGTGLSTCLLYTSPSPRD